MHSSVSYYYIAHYPMATIFNITQVFINVNSEEVSGSRRRPLQGRRRRRRKKTLKNEKEAGERQEAEN